MKKQTLEQMDKLLLAIADIIRDPDSEEQKMRHALAIQRAKLVLDGINPKTDKQIEFRTKLEKHVTAREFVMCLLDLDSETLALIASRGGDIFN